MLMSLAASALALSSTSAVTAEYDGYRRRIDTLTMWERYDIVITNNAAQTQTLTLCPRDAEQIVRTHRTESSTAFAIKFDDDGWSFNCDARELAPGEAVRLGVFFRPDTLWYTRRETQAERFLSVATSLGEFTFEGAFGFFEPGPQPETVRNITQP